MIAGDSLDGLCQLEGEVGPLECLLEIPSDGIRGLALVAHPHPLQGGNMYHKLPQTLARSFKELGCVVVRMNTRGVGGSAGTYAEGLGEARDWLRVYQWARQHYPVGPVYLAGFSFGAYVMSLVAQEVACRRLVLLGTAVRSFSVPTVPANTLVMHGQDDEVAPLALVMDWAKPQGIAVVVLPGVGHYFHQQLGVIRTWVQLTCQF